TAQGRVVVDENRPVQGSLPYLLTAMPQTSREDPALDERETTALSSSRLWDRVHARKTSSSWTSSGSVTNSASIVGVQSSCRPGLPRPVASHSNETLVTNASFCR